MRQSFNLFEKKMNEKVKITLSDYDPDSRLKAICENNTGNYTFFCEINNFIFILMHSIKQIASKYIGTHTATKLRCKRLSAVA